MCPLLDHLRNSLTEEIDQSGYRTKGSQKNKLMGSPPRTYDQCVSHEGPSRHWGPYNDGYYD